MAARAGLPAERLRCYQMPERPARIAARGVPGQGGRGSAPRARLLAKENKDEFFQIIFNSKTNGPPYPKFSRCTEPTQFPDPGLLIFNGVMLMLIE